MDWVKIIHVLCAYLVGVLFLFRGVLSLRKSGLLHTRILRITPHIIDSSLLIFGLVLMFSWKLWPTINLWLLAKIVALFIYIGFGILAMSRDNSLSKKLIGFVGGLITYFYIVGVAHSKSALPFFYVFG